MTNTHPSDWDLNRERYVLNATKLKHLNGLTATQNFLVMLRSLNTSDLAFTYMLLGHKSCLDIAKNAENILHDEILNDCHRLSDTECIEFYSYTAALREYYENCESMEQETETNNAEATNNNH